VTLPPPRDPAPAVQDVVPDVAGIVLGWRTWRVGRRAQRRAELISPLAATCWPAGRPMLATCGSRSHSPPGDRCTCGLYAAREPRALSWGPSDLEVLGVAALWGSVVEGTRGWRASHAYPRLVVAGPAVPGEQRAALARRYGVPVHPSDVAPRLLAASLTVGPGVLDAAAHGSEAEVATLLAVGR
jgi:hypothetical protein